MEFFCKSSSKSHLFYYSISTTLYARRFQINPSQTIDSRKFKIQRKSNLLHKLFEYLHNFIWSWKRLAVTCGDFICKNKLCSLISYILIDAIENRNVFSHPQLLPCRACRDEMKFIRRMAVVKKFDLIYQNDRCNLLNQTCWTQNCQKSIEWIHCLQSAEVYE